MLKSKLIKKLDDHEFFKICQYPDKKTIICLT